jgi:hypothetical protein
MVGMVQCTSLCISAVIGRCHTQAVCSSILTWWYLLLIADGFIRIYAIGEGGRTLTLLHKTRVSSMYEHSKACLSLEPIVQVAPVTKHG